MNKSPLSEEYSGHVEHSRYGKGPRITGLNPNLESLTVQLHWNTRLLTGKQIRIVEKILGYRPTFPDDGTRIVPGTAVAADLSRQTPSTVPVTHYYDLDKVCRDCARKFLFFADEQKYWYEELGFPLEADAIRCPPCRKRLQMIAGKRQRYEQLCHVSRRTVEETLEMADCCLLLIEEAVFTPRKTERIHMLLNSLPEESRSGTLFLRLTARLRSIETGSKV